MVLTKEDQWQEWYPEEAYFTADYEADGYAEEHSHELYAWYTDDIQDPWATTRVYPGDDWTEQLPGTKEAHQPMHMKKCSVNRTWKVTVSRWPWRCSQHTFPMKINIPMSEKANPRDMEKEEKVCQME